MDRDIGRGRHGRETSKAHASARLKGTAPAPKRGRGRQGQQLVQGTHDGEAGASVGSRSRSRRGRVEEPVAQPDFDTNEYINDDADYAEEQAPPAPQRAPRAPQQAPPPNEVQVYGGGPHDLSLLTEYYKHRAIPIWEANPNNHDVLRRQLRCIAAAKRVTDINKPNEDEDWFWGVVEATGLRPLVKTNFSVLDYGLIWSFAERWHPETSTFHLPIGELGITLDDVQCLLHIPIEGKFLNHRKMTREEGADMCSTYLGVSPGVVMTMFDKLGGCSGRGRYKLFCYFWSIRASWAKTTQMAGYMSFLQGWIIVHFPRLSVWGTDTSYEDHMGWNAYFVPGQGHKECDGYRLSLDNIQMSDCVFSPYDGRRHVRPLINACWFSGWIRDGDVRGKHLPERVLRQFKFVQGIPRHPSTAATPGMNLFEIDRVWMEEWELRMIDEGAEEPPRPANLEVVMEEQEARRDPNALQVCRDVSNELQRALDADEVQEGSPIWHTVRRVLGMLNPCITFAAHLYGVAGQNLKQMVPVFC
ncbi:hypothetical protein QL285_052713 [Trifolium repens]|nr:hypothetical protein QL285_052713 [Trifolium repens]